MVLFLHMWMSYTSLYDPNNQLYVDILLIQTVQVSWFEIQINRVRGA